MVGDMLQWAQWVAPTVSGRCQLSGANARSMGPQMSGRRGGMYLFRLSSLAVSACIIYSINIIITVNSVPSR